MFVSKMQILGSPIIHHMLCSPHLQVKEQCTGNGHLLTGPMATKCHLFPFSILCYAITILLQNNKCKYILRIRNHKTDFLSIQAKKYSLISIFEGFFPLSSWMKVEWTGKWDFLIWWKHFETGLERWLHNDIQSSKGTLTRRATCIYR